MILSRIGSLLAFLQVPPRNSSAARDAPVPWQAPVTCWQNPSWWTSASLAGFSIPLLCSYWDIKETHFWTPWNVFSWLLFKPFFLRVAALRECTNPITNPGSSLFVPPSCISLIICPSIITLGRSGQNRKAVRVWRRDIIISETSCGGQTLRWS